MLIFYDAPPVSKILGTELNEHGQEKENKINKKEKNNVNLKSKWLTYKWSEQWQHTILFHFLNI